MTIFNSKIHTGIKMIMLMSLSAVIFGCKSYNIPLNTALKSQNINAQLVVPEYPLAVTIDRPEGAIPAGLYIATLENTIIESYNSVDVPGVISEEFENMPEELKKNITVVSESTLSTELLITNEMTTEEYKKNQYNAKYDFSKMKNQIKTPYVFVFRIEKWGHNGKTASCEMLYSASIYKVDTNEIQWLYVSYDIGKGFMGSNLGFTPEKAEKWFRITVKQAVRKCVKNLTK